MTKLQIVSEGRLYTKHLRNLKESVAQCRHSSSDTKWQIKLGKTITFSLYFETNLPHEISQLLRLEVWGAMCPSF